MKPDEVAAKARKKIEGRPDLEAALRVSWEPVEILIDALAETFPHRNYAFQRMHRLGRLEMLTRFVEGDEPAQCALAAIDAISNDYAHRLAF